MGRVYPRHGQTKECIEDIHEHCKISVCSWPSDTELLLRSQGHFQCVNLKASGQDHAFSLVNMENPQSCLRN